MLALEPSFFVHTGDIVYYDRLGKTLDLARYHWQYASVDPKTGLREYSSGPHTDAHAGGFSEEQRSSMHRFLRIGGGFLSGTVERQDGAPVLTIRFHDVTGAIQHEDRIEAKAFLSAPRWPETQARTEPGPRAHGEWASPVE
jgi:hypothetical protein